MALKEDYKDAVFSGLRKYKTVENDDGTVSLADVTEYAEKGDKFGAKDLNEITKKINSTDEGLTNQGKKIEDLTTNMSGLTFGQNENGKWGYRVGGADPVIPFKTGEDILPSFIRHQNYVIPSRRFLLELVGYRDMYSRSSGINRYELNGADVEQEIGKYFYCICSSGHSCNSGNVGVLKLICRGTPGNAINPVVYFNESNGATGDKAQMINWIVTLTPLMEE